MDASHEAVSLDQKKEGCESSGPGFNQDDESSADYRVTGNMENLHCNYLDFLRITVGKQSKRSIS